MWSACDLRGKEAGRACGFTHAREGPLVSARGEVHSLRQETRLCRLCPEWAMFLGQALH